MRKFAGSNILVALIAATTGGASAGERSDFKVCRGAYALCTTARCTPVPGAEHTVSCRCEVKSGYSVGLEPCKGPTETSKGTRIESRYFPIESYAICSNARPWAYCFAKPCTVDRRDPTKASCECAKMRRRGPYVMVTDVYTPKTCTTGVFSSATVTELTRVTDFLKTSAELEPFEMKVLNSAK